MAVISEGQPGRGNFLRVGSMMAAKGADVPVAQAGGWRSALMSFAYSLLRGIV